MSLKMEFVEKAAKPGARMAALCRQYGISRETGYKWLNRFRREGHAGLEERSRRPRSCPLATAEDVVAAVLEAREAHSTWGPTKLQLVLQRRFGEQTPSKSTLARILRRFGQIRRRHRRPQLSVVDKAPTVQSKTPNEIWTVDFKGWWRVRDGARCEPLTVRDAHSRYVLAVKVVRSTTCDGVRKIFERLFRRYGLPEVIQCDNGSPFINTQARGGLTRLSAWWISLGIRVLRSRPGCPQDNGAHERMHRDLRAEVQAFPSGSLASEQRACEKWRQEFNHVRPHEALAGKVPADVYRPSERCMPKPRKYVYPAGWIVRTVTRPAKITIQDEQYTISRALLGHTVALEPITGLKHRLWFHDLNLGEIELCPPREVMEQIAMNMRPLQRGRKVSAARKRKAA